MILQPEPISEQHNIQGFNSGEETLDVWLKTKAIRNQKANASRTYVAVGNERVIAYYVLASSSVDGSLATGRRRNMPIPVPVVILGRLAIDLAYQHKGLGRALVRDAGLRVIQAAETIGIRGLLVHAISTNAKDFYTKLGFEPSLIDPMTLMVTLDDLKAAIQV
ncbi:GNAT family N-acetyltransferase [Legionella septentrionalis]|uniref:GNAT family N-acetyltransferase n=1 Tax=Legionella septentrionalis TaxID=2498109 RepID=UPI000F8F004F|nr:GNAT family N-acetyltransferase [Legionella septentrionalis]RUR10616.1 GNAT family N-acetyltransferase [Legionella septentrionalis]